jgi:hypothetical protein
LKWDAVTYNLPQIFYFFLDDTVLTQGFELVDTCSTVWAIPPALFALVIFSCPDLPEPQSSYRCFLPSVEWQTCATTPSYWLRWGLLNFCMAGELAVFLPISDSQVAIVMGERHWLSARFPFFDLTIACYHIPATSAFAAAHKYSILFVNFQFVQDFKKISFLISSLMY